VIPGNPCRHHVEAFTKLEQLGSNIPVSFKFLIKHGIELEPHFQRVKKLGVQNYCYMNAFNKMTSRKSYAEGYAMKAGLIPLSHAWLSFEGKALDVTWTEGSYYFGCIFDNDFVVEYVDRTGYYGIFEGLYLLKMSPEKCFDYLESGLKK
jgi:hypothetical protein